MTGQDDRVNGRTEGGGDGGGPGRDDADRFLPMIDEAAARGRLGGRRAVYQGARSQAGSSAAPWRASWSSAASGSSSP